MNARPQYTRAQHLCHLADTTRAIGARLLSALVLLPLLAACATTPGAAQQNVVKAVVREKPIASMPTPIPTTVPTAKPLPTTKPIPTIEPAPAAQAFSIGTRGGDWLFDTVELEAAVGKDIAVTFRNNAKNTTHNWLLVKGGDEVAAAINTAGETAGVAAGYIPDDARIIARTDGLLKGGQSATITFSAPAAGTYIYLCTFPGHFEEGMRGVLTLR